MEKQLRNISIEVYERDHNSKTIVNMFTQASTIIAKITASLDKYAVRVNKNIPYQHLLSITANKKVKNFLPSKYLDTNTNKVVDFPRKNSCEIYVENILIYSRLRLKKMPDLEILKNILVGVLDVCQENDEFGGFQRFRDLELQFRFTPFDYKSLYEEVSSQLRNEASPANITEILKKIHSTKINQLINNKIFFPYNRFSSREKSFKLSSIYSNSNKETKRTQAMTVRKEQTHKKQNIDKNTQINFHKIGNSTAGYYHKQLFDMVRIGGDKQTSTIDLALFPDLINLKPAKTPKSKIYFSFMEKKIQNKEKPIRLRRKSSLKRYKKKSNQSNDAVLENKIQIPSIETSKPQNSITDSDIDIKLSDLSLEWKGNQQASLSSLESHTKPCEQLFSDEPVKHEPDVIESQIQTPDIKLTPDQALSEQHNQSQQEIIIKEQSAQNIEEESEGQFKQIVLQKTFTQEEKLQLYEQFITKKMERETQWAQCREQFRDRQEASIVSRFFQQKNFQVDLVNQLFSSHNEEKYHKYSYFKITGEELTCKIRIKSLREMYGPYELKLFPNIFKEVQGYSSNLAELINIMLRSNPIIVSRIFENKKSISPEGFYCIWLKNLSGVYEPVFVNDDFAVYEKTIQEQYYDTWSSSDLVYAKLCNENSIWFMILQKAVAKIFGGYHKIAGANLATLMDVIMGYPTVDFSHLSLEKALIVFEQQKFFNKMATFYAKSYLIQENRIKNNIDRIVGFSTNFDNPRQSRIILRSGEITNELYVYQFLLQYGQVTLSFFNSYYYINQSTFLYNSPHLSLLNHSRVQFLSCRLKSVSKNNLTYLMFNFGTMIMRKPCKVSLYKHLNEEEVVLKEGMSPLSEQRSKYQYVGEIRRFGDFFFENQFDVGQYICVLQLTIEIDHDHEKQKSRPHITIFSEKQITIYQKQMTVEIDEYQNQHQTKDRLKQSSQKSLKKAPQILVEKTHPKYRTQFKEQEIDINKKAPKKRVRVHRPFMLQNNSTETEKSEKDFSSSNYFYI